MRFTIPLIQTCDVCALNYFIINSVNSYIILYNAYNHYTERSHILERFQLNFLTICNLLNEQSFSKKNVFSMLRYSHISI